jgi:hypothetical protein
VSHAENQLSGVGEVVAGMMGYAQPLRAIGQALEVLNIQDFEMEPEGDDYFVRGHMPLANNAFGNQCNADKLETIWGALPVSEKGGEKDWRPDLATLSRIELCYTVQDVELLEKAGRSRRGRSGKMADAASLSQVLRCIGAYLNQKRARLCKITREIDCVAIEYETSLGSKMEESLALKDLYDLWVRMYLQRSARITD